ncbi:hypothetical protein BDB00DRAFT_329483 [Zychaea mexicana]|uniref:uncharacterized protein n=1 Tax=Zychaea mexicana TaxID=64656 RepID=UPI0022FE85BF|nr:uncharacterized protein BDB00DRAFT_329483 [Zychaea mexicana]KAI9498994.1 hypothetical protein BDB00DRAFT_329483 [Zychaea mexicana]
MLKRWHSKRMAGLHELPTLEQVLRRQSRPPVCLYNYYIVLRDRLELETLLDFWLDVQQARVLHRRYLKQQQQQLQSKKSFITLSPTPSNLSHEQQLTHSLLLASSAPSVVTETHMAQVVERIYLRYIVPSAEKELFHLPLSMRDAITEKGLADDPVVYNQAQKYVYQLLQATWPQFLQYKVFMNLTLHQQLGRVAVGLASLLIGFSIEFSLIFLNFQPWHYRLSGIVPILFGVYCLISGLTGVDPIWVLAFNVSETTTFHFNRIQQPKVREILVARSVIVLSICLLITIILLVLFCAVPGKRL